MVKQEIKVLAGYEEIYDKLVVMKNGIEEEVRKQIEEKAQKINNMIAEITEVVEIEVPEETEEVVETTEQF